jgi:hypothetical protein
MVKFCDPAGGCRFLNMMMMNKYDDDEHDDARYMCLCLCVYVNAFDAQVLFLV